MRSNSNWRVVFAAMPVFFLLVSIAFSAEDNKTARDGTFVAYENGVVKDSKTGLEWIAGPDRDITWKEARTWVQELTVGGGGWQMPTREELKTLYKQGAGTRNMTPLLKTTGFRVWTKETKDSSLAWAVDFFFSDENWVVLEDAYHTRGFAVRSSK